MTSKSLQTTFSEQLPDLPTTSTSSNMSSSDVNGVQAQDEIKENGDSTDVPVELDTAEEEDLVKLDKIIGEAESMIDRAMELEEETAKLEELQSGEEKALGYHDYSAKPERVNLSFEEKQEVDSRSVYVGNVDYSATEDELQEKFFGSGSIKRVTILRNSSGNPKGCAYIEFDDESAVQVAMAMDDTLFKGRMIKVTPKRTNLPGMSERGGRGGYRGNQRALRRGFRGSRGFRGITRGFRGGARGRPRSHFVYRHPAYNPY